jgi:murein DD-endopeptidase MepM/ murein hydrolase activator NlpD
MYSYLLKTISVIIICVSLLPSGMVQAQDTPPSGPVYIVQEGDALWDIAYRFHISPEALANANGIVNANQISVGQELIIPGLEGIQGILTTETVPFGESLQSLSLRYEITTQMLKRLNNITSPNELYAGYSLVIPQRKAPSHLGKRASLEAGQSILELATLNDTNPWNLTVDNGYENSWSVLPGEVLRTPGDEDTGPGGLPSAISDVNIPKLTQGQTAEIQVAGEANLLLSGTLGEHALNFFPDGNNNYTALQGVHAMAEPGLYPLTLWVTTPDGSQTSFLQMVMVNAGDFLYDRSLPVDPATLDPETNREENELWSESSSGVTPEKMWNGIFYLPVDPVFAECYTSRFGSRRSYNGGEYNYFHTGLDFCGQVSDPIYATAPGVVVFAGPLTVRGNATMIDHGRGVYSAYMHQSEILVNEGDHVEEGQLIGRVGNTGRVEGPHLHFEVLVGGVQVDPLEWLDGEYP